MAARRTSKWLRASRCSMRHMRPILSGSFVVARPHQSCRRLSGSTHQPRPEWQNRHLLLPIRRFSCWPDREEMRHRALPKSSLNLSHRYLTHSGDSVYGDDRALRLWLEQRQQAYVLAVSGKESVWLGAEQRQIKTILAELPTLGWERLSAGAGSKGSRSYDWRRLELSAPALEGWKRFLLIRRSISDPSEMTGYIIFAKAHTT